MGPPVRFTHCFRYSSTSSPGLSVIRPGRYTTLCPSAPLTYDDAEDDASEGSGSLPAREALLADARSPERVDTVLVWKRSRLSRNILEFQTIVSVLEESGVTVTSVTETVGSSSTDSLLGSFIRALEEFERKRHREATRRGIAAARLRRQGG